MSDEKKKLYRSRKTVGWWVFAAVWAITFNLDPTIIRVLFVLFSFAVGGGILIYLILWIVIPLEPPEVIDMTEVPPEEE